eukprot:scaffold16452_cov46-Prasinocladus_malaysianus.AAC.1
MAYDFWVGCQQHSPVHLSAVKVAQVCGCNGRIGPEEERQPFCHNCRLKRLDPQAVVAETAPVVN